MRIGDHSVGDDRGEWRGFVRGTFFRLELSRAKCYLFSVHGRFQFRVRFRVQVQAWVFEFRSGLQVCRM